MPEFDIVGISGSLRRGSYNSALLRASQALVPKGMTIRIVDYSQVPLYNMDLEQEFPESVIAFKEEVRRADGILFASPEHNFSMSGVLKNAIDWGSRPHEDSVWSEKPVIVQSASPSWTGGLRSQYHLFQVLDYFEMRHQRFPEVVVGSCRPKFDENLELTDEMAIQAIRKQLAKFSDFIAHG